MSFGESLRALVEDSSVVWGFLIAAAIVLVVTPLTASVAYRVGALDIPSDRPRVHSRPIPRIGGVAIMIGIMVPALAFVADDGGPYLGILLGTIGVALLGLVDDVHGLKPIAKLVGVMAIALVPVVGWD